MRRPNDKIIYVCTTPAEYELLEARAKRAKMTIPNYIRQAINSMWLEEGLDGSLLDERSIGRPQEP